MTSESSRAAADAMARNSASRRVCVIRRHRWSWPFVGVIVGPVGPSVPSTTGRSKPSNSRRAFGQRQQLACDDLGGLANDLLPALPADGPAHARIQQAHVVVNLGDGADRRARVADAVLLADGDRRANAFDLVDVGLLHPLEELAGIGGERLDIAPLPFGVNGVEGERRLARAADAGEHDQLARLGSVTSMFLRLCVRAPRMTRGGLSEGGGMVNCG